ncbi:unnamed protein product [Dicrocoelium dendriticum]|nr:unnamed protein product [Dicrocoelium dendriticum]
MLDRGAPTNVVVVNLRPGSQRITWNHTAMHSRCSPMYMVRYRPSAASSGSWSTVKTTEPTFTLSGLAEFTEYAYSVEVMDQPGSVHGTPTTEVVLRTMASKPNSPFNLTSMNVSATRLHLSWCDSEVTEGFHVTQYVITLLNNFGATTYILPSNPGVDTSLEAELPVDSCTEYMVYVQSVDEAYNLTSNPSEPILVHSLAPEPAEPNFVELHNTGVGTQRLIWDGPQLLHACRHYYLVEYQPIGQNTTQTLRTPITQHEYTFTGLTDCTVYAYSVRVESNPGSILGRPFPKQLLKTPTPTSTIHKRQFHLRHSTIIGKMAPLENTVGDFWRMVIEQNTAIIIMLTGLMEAGREKCARYWPATQGETAVYTSGADELIVTLTNEVVTPAYINRTLNLTLWQSHRCEITQPANTLEITQLHMSSWPDFGVPSMADFHSLLLVHQHLALQQNSPCLIHCSAGIGRTGTFIVACLLLQHLKNPDCYIDLAGTVRQLRMCRMRMVQKPEQYRFLHQYLKAILDEKITV